MRRCLVIGSPIAHSRSPLIHRLFAEQQGIALCYEKREVTPGTVAPLLSDCRANGVLGLNVTLPLKEEAFAAADIHHPRAAEAEAANTLWFDQQGRINADNTDGQGLLGDLARMGVELSNATVLMLGAGGAAKGVLGALLGKQPARLAVMNRTPARADALASRYGIESLPPNLVFRQPFDVVINATSMGLTGASELALSPSAVGIGTTCYDMVYGNAETAFLRWAAGCGATRRYDGLGMLVGQAAEAFRLWHGQLPSVQPVIDFLRRRLKS